MRQYRDLEERLIVNSIVDVDGPLFEGTHCWLWIGRRRPNGYGALNVRVDGRHVTLSAHRTAYEELVGPIPEGYQIDHKCCVLLCINPNHHEAVPCAVNAQRRDARRA